MEKDAYTATAKNIAKQVMGTHAVSWLTMRKRVRKKLHSRGYPPIFVRDVNASVAALIQASQEALVQCMATWRWRN
ncbi:MAG: hypothetical protein VB049_07470 [Candidatus Pelethousia sp.]|nr:hypothetical protein [Candidatus Pelethousia sp.]